MYEANEKLHDDVSSPSLSFWMELIFILVNTLIRKITAFEPQKTHTWSYRSKCYAEIWHNHYDQWRYLLHRNTRFSCTRSECPGSLMGSHFFYLKLLWKSFDSGQDSSSRQAVQTKMQKIFFRWFPLSRFLAKTLRIIKTAMKSFSKIFDLNRSESTSDCRSRQSRIKLTHTT